MEREGEKKEGGDAIPAAVCRRTRMTGQNKHHRILYITTARGRTGDIWGWSEGAVLDRWRCVCLVSLLSFSAWGREVIRGERPAYIF